MLHAYVVWKIKGLCNVQALIRFGTWSPPCFNRACHV